MDDEKQAYRNLIVRYHRKGREGKCPYCREQWPCFVYQQVVKPT